MTSGTQKQGMPGWLKVVIIVAIVGVVGFIAICGGLALFVTSAIKGATDPKQITAVANSFMKMGDPLPAGFEYKFGFDLIGNKIVTICNTEKKLTLIFGAFKDAKGLDDPEKIIDAMNSTKAATGSAADAGSAASPSVPDGAAPVGAKAHKFEAQSTGVDTVGGKKLSYTVGISTDAKTGRKVPTFIGIFPAEENRAICIFGVSEAETYDLDSTKTLLKNIQSI